MNRTSLMHVSARFVEVQLWHKLQTMHRESPQVLTGWGQYSQVVSCLITHLATAGGVRLEMGQKLKIALYIHMQTATH